ncbi:hypothetical protein ES332_D11G141200v1 [Gossypium tomentosum]|uniref:Uncharacterized protein n=1 Tax=Gossypium tomentosum TaxID=34277 RepID=A0A5D2IN45_GOSTO|nr:hypothetical protein ES332_D11G141200v1 [Gossypium tomentosum]
MMHPPRTNSGNPDPGPPSFTYHLIQIVQIIECNNEMREQMGPFPWMKIQIREEMCGEYQRIVKEKATAPPLPAGHLRVFQRTWNSAFFFKLSIRLRF